jgi:glycosyltransferase involved in cell wall biosynthesis
MGRPDFSVVVPLFNKRHTLRRCLESVLAQSERSFELIVIDDGSTDGSADVAATVGDPRLRLVRQDNRGVSAARNRGIELARAGLIAFLDADDLWEPGFLSAISVLARQFPDAALMATAVGRCWLDGRPDLLIGVRSPGPAGGVLVEDYFRTAREGDFISASNVCIRRRALEQCGGFLEGESHGEDVELWARLNLSWPFACHPEVLAWYFTPPQDTPHLMRPLSVDPPLVVRRLLERLSDADMSSAFAKRILEYADHQLARHADSLLWRGDARQLARYLEAAPFSSAGTAFRYRALSWAARRVSARLARLLRWGPERLLSACGLPLRRGRLLDVRSRPCRHLKTGAA